MWNHLCNSYSNSNCKMPILWTFRARRFVLLTSWKLLTNNKIENISKFNLILIWCGRCGGGWWTVRPIFGLFASKLKNMPASGKPSKWVLFISLCENETSHPTMQIEFYITAYRPESFLHPFSCQNESCLDVFLCKFTRLP